MVRKKLLVLGALALGLAPSASALVIDFEGHPNDFGNPIDHQGYQFTFGASGWAVVADDYDFSWVRNGTTRLIAGGDRDAHTGQVMFKPLDDSPFDLFEFDASVLFASYQLGQIEVIGTYETGGSVNSFFDVTNTFQKVVMGAGYTNLDNVLVRTTYSGAWGQEPGFEMDNIATAPVPEPLTLTVLAGAGLAFFGRRRK